MEGDYYYLVRKGLFEERKVGLKPEQEGISHAKSRAEGAAGAKAVTQGELGGAEDQRASAQQIRGEQEKRLNRKLEVTQGAWICFVSAI